MMAESRDVAVRDAEAEGVRVDPRRSSELDDGPHAEERRAVVYNTRAATHGPPPAPAEALAEKNAENCGRPGTRSRWPCAQGRDSRSRVRGLA